MRGLLLLDHNGLTLRRSTKEIKAPAKSLFGAAIPVKVHEKVGMALTETE
jgi:hypothetical protein